MCVCVCVCEWVGGCVCNSQTTGETVCLRRSAPTSHSQGKGCHNSFFFEHTAVWMRYFSWNRKQGSVATTSKQQACFTVDDSVVFCIFFTGEEHAVQPKIAEQMS